MITRKRSHPLALLFGLFTGFWMLVIFYMSGRSEVVDPGGLLEFDHGDKALHLVEYFILGTFMFMTFCKLELQCSPRTDSMAVALLTSLYGFTDEVHQAFIPGREMSLGDILMDTVGALLAAVVYMLLLGWRPSLDRDPPCIHGAD